MNENDAISLSLFGFNHNGGVRSNEISLSVFGLITTAAESGCCYAVMTDIH